MYKFFEITEIYRKFGTLVHKIVERIAHNNVNNRSEHGHLGDAMSLE